MKIVLSVYVLVKKLIVWQLKVELEILHKLKFYSSILLLMIEMNQLLPGVTAFQLITVQSWKNVLIGKHQPYKPKSAAFETFGPNRTLFLYVL